MNWVYRYAGRMALYFLNKCELKTDVDKSNITVGSEGNIDSLLNSLSYTVAEERELELA